MDAQTALDHVKEYYGKTLRTNEDLKTGACCTADSLPGYVRAVLSTIEDEIVEKFYGCGSPIPLELTGRTVLDLGCGTGRDVYIVAKLVGPEGRVIGIDMTEEQLAVARRHVDSQMRRFGFEEPNVDFRPGYIEDLRSLGVEDESIDVVISNCVINLSPDKRRVFSEIFRVLRPGGELLFSDVFTDRRVPTDVARDPVLLGECLGGALYTEDFRRLLVELGYPDPRVLASRRISLDDPKVATMAGMIAFSSRTIRAFKLEGLEDQCEDYGQVAIYRGTLPESPHAFVLDAHHVFQAGKPMPVCGNTAAMLEKTRYARHFTILGDRSTHYGKFDCSGASRSATDATPGGCC